ncbi:MAG: HDIG domain-containing protein [Candidatus Moranbacteria bacterium]|nr:HDIG domain-containing protein [Candidatus Moranbacteria bacterium]
MQPFQIINQYHNPNSKNYQILIIHSILVANLALSIAKEKYPEADQEFIHQAALLHDIGFNLPDIPNNQDRFLPLIKKQNFYLGHGYWGSKILIQENLPKHAQVAANHIGVGLKKQEIQKHSWPLPKQNFLPSTLEQKIISYADLFYSKKPGRLFEKETQTDILKQIRSFDFSQEKIATFKQWVEQFD